jgi:peptidoglycan LD-endopeptidase CwlK
MATKDKLNGVHPDLVTKITKVHQAMGILGFPMIVTDGLRTDIEQAALYAKGRTTPGKIVTNADGVKNKSNHQAKADGFGHAVDSCFMVNGKPSWDEKLPWNTFGACAKAVGLVWGGDWKFKDKPHVELP